MNKTVAVGVRRQEGSFETVTVRPEALNRVLISRAFFKADFEAFEMCIGDHRSGGAGAAFGTTQHVPAGPHGTDYILFDFVERRIASVQTLLAVVTISRAELQMMRDERPYDAVAVVEAITHKDLMADGIGLRPGGPFNGDSVAEACRFANIHERFMTYHFSIPGWETTAGMILAGAYEKVYEVLRSCVELSLKEHRAWVDVIARAGINNAVFRAQ